MLAADWRGNVQRDKQSQRRAEHHFRINDEESDVLQRKPVKLVPVQSQTNSNLTSIICCKHDLHINKYFLFFYSRSHVFSPSFTHSLSPPPPASSLLFLSPKPDFNIFSPPPPPLFLKICDFHHLGFSPHSPPPSSAHPAYLLLPPVLPLRGGRSPSAAAGGGGGVGRCWGLKLMRGAWRY